MSEEMTGLWLRQTVYKGKMFGYMTFLKTKNKTKIKIIQSVFMRRQVKLHFRPSNPNNTVISVEYLFLPRLLWRFGVQYKLIKSSFSSTIGIFIIDLNDICYYSTFHSNVTNNSNQVMSSPWSYRIWIYNYLCNQCLSPLTLWVRTPFMTRCTRYNIMWSSLSVSCGMSVVFSGYSGFHQ